MLFRLKFHPRLLSFRIAVFNIIFVDYLIICLRTLGQGIGMFYQSTWDLLGLAAASFLIFCMVLELVFVYTKVNQIQNKNRLELTEREKVIYDVFYEGIVSKRIRDSWFVRNYQVLYMMRYFGVILFLVNLQFLQIFQVGLSLVLFIGFSVKTFTSQLGGGGLFERRWDRIWKLFEEAFLSITMFVVAIFCVDSIRALFSVSIKQRLALFLIFLLIVTIMVELVVAMIAVGKFLLDLYAAYKIRQHEKRVLEEKEEANKESADRINIKIYPSQDPRSERELLVDNLESERREESKEDRDTDRKNNAPKKSIKVEQIANKKKNQKKKLQLPSTRVVSDLSSRRRKEAYRKHIEQRKSERVKEKAKKRNMKKVQKIKKSKRKKKPLASLLD